MKIPALFFAVSHLSHFPKSMNDLHIEHRPVASLLPYARNARTHSEAQITQIAASIREFGNSNFRFCVENDCYAVDSDGHVYRVCRQQYSKSGRLIRRYETIRLSGSSDVDGYIVYRMMVDGEKKHVKGHRLVLNAFLGTRPTLCVNHRNGIKTDNRLENLEWVTVAQNNAHAIRTGLLNPRDVDHSWHTKITKADYVTIYILHRHFGIPRSQLAQQNRVCRQTIDVVVASVRRVLEELHAAV